MRLCIFGTRTFYNNKEAAHIIDEQIQTLKPEIILTAGDADGVCKLAIEKAKEHAIPCEIHFLNQKRYARGMYDHRSRDILKHSDYVLFIHDGFSQGTKNEIKQAQNMGLGYKYFKVTNEPAEPVDPLKLLKPVKMN